MFLYLNSVTLICLLEKAPFNYIKEQWWKVTYIHSSNVLKYSFVPFYAALYLYSTFHIFKLASISQTNMRKEISVAVLIFAPPQPATTVKLYIKTILLVHFADDDRYFYLCRILKERHVIEYFYCGIYGCLWLISCLFFCSCWAPYSFPLAGSYGG